jgi:hypothetical protein
MPYPAPRTVQEGRIGFEFSTEPGHAKTLRVEVEYPDRAVRERMRLINLSRAEATALRDWLTEWILADVVERG